MPRLAIVGFPGRIAQAYLKPRRQLLLECGDNTGNLAFMLAVERHVACDYAFFGWDFDPGFVRANFDVVLFVGANQLYEAYDLGGLADQFAALDLPLIVVGLGAQAGSYRHPVALRPGTRRLLHVFAERCSAIGMRGAFSAEVARQHGAENLVLIGCPSNFLNTDWSDLGRRVAGRMHGLEQPYRLALSLDLWEHLRPIVQRCVGWMDEWGGFIVCQNPESAVALALGEADGLAPEERDGFAGIVLGRPFDAEAARFFAAHCIAFFDAEAWMAHLRPSRFALGTRLHGNLLALQSGVPAAIVPHDSRTREVAETIGMPIVEEADLLAAPSLPALIAELAFDGAAYDRRRAELASAYTGLFAAAGIPLQPGIATLADRILAETAVSAP